MLKQIAELRKLIEELQKQIKERDETIASLKSELKTQVRDAHILLCTAWNLDLVRVFRTYTWVC